MTQRNNLLTNSGRPLRLASDNSFTKEESAVVDSVYKELEKYAGAIAALAKKLTAIGLTADAGAVKAAATAVDKARHNLPG